MEKNFLNITPESGNGNQEVRKESQGCLVSGFFV